jgi:hypothetical protein
MLLNIVRRRLNIVRKLLWIGDSEGWEGWVNEEIFGEKSSFSGDCSFFRKILKIVVVLHTEFLLFFNKKKMTQVLK